VPAAKDKHLVSLLIGWADLSDIKSIHLCLPEIIYPAKKSFSFRQKNKSAAVTSSFTGPFFLVGGAYNFSSERLHRKV
jgi:hypothetical protein